MRTGITIKIFLLCSLLVLLLLPDARSQSPRFDYDRYPELDFTFSRLTLELNVDPEEQLLEGQATYQVAANIGGVDSLVLDAAHMEIRNVKVDGAEASYRLRNDSLFVAFAGPVRRGDRFAVDILYETSPIFGVHFEGESTAWSSSLPLSNRHWLPTVDHPRVTFNTDITLTIPGNMTAAAPGKIVSEEVSSVEQKNVRFRSDRPVPANMLWFAVGPFQRMETSFGIKQIQVLGPPDMMRQSGKKLLEQAYRLLEQAERRLGVEYPFETFQVLLLDYHRWETKSYNAGITYLFGNRGDLTAQLQRGVYSQWVGVMQREEQWSDAEAIIMHQVALNHRLRSGSESLLSDVDNPVVSVNPYHAFSVKHWNDWQQFYPNWEDSTWKTVIEEQLLPGLAEGGSVSGWNDFAEQWYEESGQPWFQPPQLALPSGPDTGPVTAGDSLVYRVDYQYDETKGELVLHFQALDSVVTELVSLPVIEYTGQQADTMQVTFTGADDKIMLNLDPLVSFVVIDETVVQNLRLEEYKPVPFILGQLRNATTAVQKAEAARQLARHTDNPDLQLAIMDLLSREQPPRVKAALYRSLGEITGGASGTEQQFLDALGDESPRVKEAAAGALRYFKGNQQVLQALRRTAMQADTISLFRTSVNSLVEAADSAAAGAVTSLVQNVVSSDSSGHRAIYLLQTVAGQEFLERDELINYLELLAGANYSYGIRSAALDLLISFDNRQERWNRRIEQLLADSDPRMRLHAVKAVENLSFLDAEALLQGTMLDEYDGRVYYEMRSAVRE